MKKTGNILVIGLIFLLSHQAIAQQGKVGPTSYSKAVYFDRIGPLKDFPPMTAEDFIILNEKEKNKVRNKDLQYRAYPNAENALPKGPDPVWQKEMGASRSGRNIIQNFEGQSTFSSPPDCNGSAGPEHFFQTVNVTYSIYDKTGNQVVPPTNLNTLFAGVPGSNNNDGDPILLYDDNADRWMAAEFSGAWSGPDYMMIAISVTNDPTGDWYRWSWLMNGFPDYMKFGVWEDGYYMGTNTMNGDDIYVFERDEMLVGGTSPQMVQFNNPWRPNSGFHCVLPVDIDGGFAPADSPGMFITINDDAWGGGGDALWVYELDVDWTTPNNSTFDRTQQISVSSFDSNFGPSWDNIKQPGTGQELDAINQILMFRAQYRNFGSDKRIVCNHTVDVDGTDHAGVRWYELQLNGSDWEVRQEGTYAPDEHSRWMASIAMNGSKEIALGYSISSNTVYPGIRYCGQSAAENSLASGVMDIAEEVIKEGAFSQSGTNRWGDYSLMSVDVADDKTFWFTSQYNISSNKKGTKVASIMFEEVLMATFTGTPTSIYPGSNVYFTDQSTGSPTSWEWTFEGGDPATSTEQNPVITYNALGTFDVTLTVTNATGSNTLTKEDYVEVVEEVLQIDPGSATVSNEAGSLSVTLTTGSAWSATEDCDWVSVSPTGGIGGGSITVTYDENTTAEDRECIITFSTSNSSVDFILTQNGIAQVLTLDPESGTVDYTASSTGFSITSNTGWTITESCDWVSVSPETGNGNENITINYDENPMALERVCVINVAGSEATADFTLTQSAAPAFINTDPSTQTVAADAGNLQVNISASVNWTVSEQCDWLSVSPENGSGNGTITLTYLENESFDDRVCTISLSGDGVTSTVELTQEGVVAYMDLNPVTKDVTWEAGDFQVDVSTNTDWSVTNGCEWITVDPASGSQTGSFALSYVENPDAESRSCVVTVSGEGLIRELTVNQQANASSIDELLANQIKLFPNPATSSFTIESENSIQQIRIVDMAGRLVAVYVNPGSNFTVDTEDWKKGTYFISINQNKTIISGTLLIQ